MTTRMSWCFGPEGAVVHHETCRYEVAIAGTVVRCGCPCHEGRESGESALGMGGLGVAAWDNGGTNQQCPEPARTDPGRRPHPAKEL
jgi:hypothetical protein